MVFEFLNTLKNRTSKVRSTHQVQKKKNLQKKHAIKKEAMHDIMHEPMILNIGSIDAWT